MYLWTAEFVCLCSLGEELHRITEVSTMERSRISLLFLPILCIVLVSSTLAQSPSMKPASFPDDTSSAILMVLSFPDSAQVYFDDSIRGLTPLTLRDIVPGIHTVRVTKEDYS